MKGSDLALLAVAGFVGYSYLKREKKESFEEGLNSANNSFQKIIQDVQTVAETLPSGATIQITPNTGVTPQGVFEETVVKFQEPPLVGLGAGFENLLDTIADLKAKVENAPTTTVPLIYTTSPTGNYQTDLAIGRSQGWVPETPADLGSTPRITIPASAGLTGLPGQILSGDRLMTPVAPGVYEPYPGWYAQIQAATAAQRAAGFL